MNIPFSEININPEHGLAIIKAIRFYEANHVGQPISLQKVVEYTGFSGHEVKDVFFALLTLRHLKPTFQPRHNRCECIGLRFFGHVFG